MNQEIFRTYDIRGIADRDLDDALATKIGRAFGSRIRRDGGKRVALGRDCRLHSPRLHAALCRGILATGLEVIDIGVVPTPLLYFAVYHLDLDGGLQITGSHNAADYNGFKMMRGHGSLWGDGIQELAAWIRAGDFVEGQGSTRPVDLGQAYLEDILGRLSLGGRRLRVVLDGGNGTGGPLGVALLRRLGFEVFPLHEEMDGRFPNHHPDPTVPANLRDLIHSVREVGADLGIAYDGDADRIGVVDERGEVIWGDRLLVILARDLLARVPGAAIVGEVKCSKTLFDAIAAAGGRPIMSAVGHSIIKTRMKHEGALLAGEMSGHIFYQDRWYGFDDAIHATARLCEILTHHRGPLSALLADLPVTHATPELRLDCPEAMKVPVVTAAIAHFKKDYAVVDIDGARIDFGDGWGLVRASNTQPALVLRAEAATVERLAEIRETIERFVARAVERHGVA
jgi:phosphomannomutase/phosphoglucomutase